MKLVKPIFESYLKSNINGNQNMKANFKNVKVFFKNVKAFEVKPQGVLMQTP